MPGVQEPGGRHYRAELGRLAHAAAGEAEFLDHDWLGPGHLVLAVIRSRPDSPSTIALARAGVTYATVAEGLSNHLVTEPAKRNATIEVNPATYQLLGRAEGIAVGMGASEVNSEHALIAYLWDRDASSDIDLLGEGVRAGIIEELRALGTAIPEVPFPVQTLSRSGPRVFIPRDKLMRVVDGLERRLPKGAGLGFNEDDNGNAWVTANADIDLDRYVREVSDEQEIEL